jgi:cytochrome c
MQKEGQLKEKTMNFKVLTWFGACFFLAQPVMAEGDTAKGATIFKKCMACHEATKPLKKTGPHLMGIVGRPVASVEGFTYSKGMIAFAATSGVWDEAKLDVYFTDPRKAVPGTKMAFGPLKKPDERADLIAYLKTLPAP